MVVALDLRPRGGLVIGITDRKTGQDQVNPPDELQLHENSMVLYLARERLLGAA